MVRLWLPLGQSTFNEMEVRRFWWCLGRCSGGRALAAVFWVNLLAVNGFFEMHEEIGEPTEMTQVNESKYSSETDSREKVTEDYDGSG
jgi:hypothetical protein